jgi:hypothetical protein
MNTPDVSRACRGAALARPKLSAPPTIRSLFRSTSLNLHGLPMAAPYRRNAAFIQAFAIPIALVISFRRDYIDHRQEVSGAGCQLAR